MLLLCRGRAFAIGTRKDLDWNGNNLNEENKKLKKQKEIEEFWDSVWFFDWQRCEDKPFASQFPNSFKTKISVVNQDTQTAAENLVKKYPNLDPFKKNCSH